MVAHNSSTALTPSSTEIRVSPTKPCGKGSKRKQDDLDKDDEEEEHQTWVEALSQELAEDEDPEEDPDYEVGVKLLSEMLVVPGISVLTVRAPLHSSDHLINVQK